ncbi:MAG: DUF72 domain-containing protein [Gemmatimonadetes bacterium]|nr:DUF72 domain-containing protein [Gemmatimonadota bacterium]
MAGILLGTQGWNHPAWVGPFYPHGSKAGELLPTYARAFSTVEIDATFYAIPAEPIVAGWREQAPPGFTFALKVPQEITHEKRLVDVDQRLARFLHRVRGLGDRLGPLLLQMSPDFRPTEAMRGVLKSFLATLSSEFRWAIEFRQPHWLSSETMDILREHRVALTLVDGRWIRRGVVLDLALEPTSDFSYVRWMGPARKLTDHSRVQVERTRELTVWANALRVLAERVGVVYGYFHNHFQGHAPASAREMQRLVGIEPVEPAMLREQAELF